MGEMASIDIPAMTNLVNAATSAEGNIPYLQWGLQSALNPVDVDASPASKLATVAAWCGDSIPGLQRRLTMAQAIESKTPSLGNVVKIDESTVSTKTPAQAVAQAQADAAALKGAHGIPSQAVLDSISRNSNDPYYAQAFANSTTPTDLSNALLNATSKHRVDGTSSIPMTADQIKAWQAQYGQLLSGVSATIATATRGTGPLALPTGYAQSFADTMTDEHAPPGQASALALILKSGGTFGTPFLDTVSSTVYDYERTHSGSGPLWRPRAYLSDGTFEGPDNPDGSNADSDPLAGIMAALGNSPQAAQDFFDVGNPNAKTTQITLPDGTKVNIDDRLKYLIQDRTWSPGAGSDNGAGLGAALQAATTQWRDQSSNGAVSATIAAQMIAAIGGKTGDGQEDSHWYELGLNGKAGWQMWGGMRTNVANILSSYAPDLMRVAGCTEKNGDPVEGHWTIPSGGLLPPNGPLGAWLNTSALKNVISTLGEDPKNIDIVNAGVMSAGRLMLDYQLQQELLTDPNAKTNIIRASATEPGIVGATNLLAKTLGFTFTAGYHGDKDQQAFDQARAAAISKLTGAVLSLPTFALPEGHEWAGALIDIGKDQILDHLGEGPDQDAGTVYTQNASTDQTSIQHLTLNEMLVNGYLDPSAFTKANADEGVSVKYVPPPESAIIRDANGNPTGFDFSSPAYQTWEESGQGLMGWLQNAVVDPFHTNLDTSS